MEEERVAAMGLEANCSLARRHSATWAVCTSMAVAGMLVSAMVAMQAATRAAEVMAVVATAVAVRAVEEVAAMEAVETAAAASAAVPAVPEAAAMSPQAGCRGLIF